MMSATPIAMRTVRWVIRGFGVRVKTSRAPAQLIQTIFDRQAHVAVYVTSGAEAPSPGVL